MPEQYICQKKVGSVYVIIAQTMGLPGELEGEIVAGPYLVSLPKGININSRAVQLSLRLNEVKANVKLFGWTTDGWQEYKAQISGKVLTAEVDRATTFVAVALPESS